MPVHPAEPQVLLHPGKHPPVPNLPPVPIYPLTPV
jgi:hypothetical protein